MAFLTLTEWIGSTGVLLLLGAFVANLPGWLGRGSGLYHLGDALAGWPSWRLELVSSAVLGGIWAGVAPAVLLCGSGGGGGSTRCRAGEDGVHREER